MIICIAIYINCIIVRCCIRFIYSRVVGEKHNYKSSPSSQYYETPYSLLDALSPMYRAQFSSLLSAKLEALAAQTE